MKRLLLTLMGVSAMVTVLVGQDLEVCAPKGYTLTSASATTGASTYQWYEDGNLISGSAATLSIPAGKPSGVYHYVRMASNEDCEVASNTFTVRVWAEVPPPTITSPADGCAGSSYVFTVPLEDGVTYTWTGGGGDNAASGNSYTYANAAAGALTVTVQASENGSICWSAPAAATATAYARPEITGLSAGTAIYIGTAATLSVTANPATGYQWMKNGAFTSEGSNYTSTTYTTATLTASATYSVVVFNDACSVTSEDVVVSIGISQPQGSCTYTEPAMMWTFANFPADYNASTYVTLTDERDNKNYPVVKIGGRWIMARNLNYQGTNSSNTLTWQANANSPSSVSGSNRDLIGHFWCPGSHGSTVSTHTSCDVWGALYSWETAMMVDGRWTSSSHSSSSWSETPSSSWGAATASGNPQNHARSDDGGVTGGRGICPPNWHVPTDEEWGELLNAMESVSGTPTHNTGTDRRGVDAGARGKSTCMCTSGSCTTDEDVSWNYSGSSSSRGIDFYGFRVLPSGYRSSSSFYTRGNNAYFWSSSVNSGTAAWCRDFVYSNARVNRLKINRFYGMSVRCIRNEL